VKNSISTRHADFSEEPRDLGFPTHVYPYTAGIIGGLVGGVAMTIPALIYGFVSGYGPWYPVNLVAATVLPHMQVMTPQEFAMFDPLYLVVGTAIHLTVAAALGLVFAMLLPTLPGRPEIWALIVGPLLWFGATIIVLPNINPAMSRLLDWYSFGLANLVYGLTMGLWVAHTPKVLAHTAHHLHLQLPSFLRGRVNGL
jgi:hypothetical protein